MPPFYCVSLAPHPTRHSWWPPYQLPQPSQLLQLQLWRLLGFAAGFLKGEETNEMTCKGNEFKNHHDIIKDILLIYKTT